MKNTLIALLSFGALASTVAVGMEVGGDRLATPRSEVARQLQSPSTIAVQLEQLHAVEDSREHSGNERDRAIVSAYERIFVTQRGSALELVTDGDLQILFDAASTAVFYSGKPSHANELARLLAELDARGLSSKQHRVKMQRALVRARMLERARSLQLAYPSDGLEILPEFNMAPDLEGPTAWRVSLDERLLVEKAINVQGQTTVIVVSRPTCRYSNSAVAAITDDSVLGPLFARHALWLAPPVHAIDFDLMQQWNREHPNASMSLAVEGKDWSMIDNWNTPTFYFLKDGKVVDKVQGWPLDGTGRRREVAEALRNVGLL